MKKKRISELKSIHQFRPSSKVDNVIRKLADDQLAPTSGAFDQTNDRIPRARLIKVLVIRGCGRYRAGSGSSLVSSLVSDSLRTRHCEGIICKKRASKFEFHRRRQNLRSGSAYKLDFLRNVNRDVRTNFAGFQSFSRETPSFLGFLGIL